MKRIESITVTMMVLSIAAPAFAQSNIDENNKFGWAENVGWSNWRDANLTADGVDVGSMFLSGWIWFENVGWVTVGDGTPGGGTFYTNTTGTDHGVNIIDAQGNLEGLAWGENIGWINFDTSSAGGLRARFDPQLGRFRGYAWGENVGWLNLDDSDNAVAIPDCPKFDGDGDVDLGDFAIFSLCYAGTNNPPAASCPPGTDADFDNDGDVDMTDYSVFQLCFGGANNPIPPTCPLGGC